MRINHVELTFLCSSVYTVPPILKSENERARGKYDLRAITNNSGSVQ